MRVKIGNKAYNLTVADTDKLREKGLQGVESLPENEGMMFIYDEEEDVSFWMKDTLIPLDIIFVDDDMEVISVKQGEPMDETPITEENVMYVIEVNQGSGVQPEDDVDLVDYEQNKMYVIDEKGKAQMELDGGERIFSRIHTKALIKAAKKASALKTDASYRALGRKVFAIMHKHDTQEQDFVEK